MDKRLASLMKLATSNTITLNRASAIFSRQREKGKAKQSGRR